MALPLWCVWAGLRGRRLFDGGRGCVAWSEKEKEEGRMEEDRERKGEYGITSTIEMAILSNVIG